MVIDLVPLFDKSEEEGLLTFLILDNEEPLTVKDLLSVNLRIFLYEHSLLVFMQFMHCGRVSSHLALRCLQGMQPFLEYALFLVGSLAIMQDG